MTKKTTAEKLWGDIDKMRRKYGPPPSPPAPLPDVVMPRPLDVRTITNIEDARQPDPPTIIRTCCNSSEAYDPRKGGHDCKGDPLRSNFVNIIGSWEWAEARRKAAGVVNPPPPRIEVTTTPCPCGDPNLPGTSHACNLGPAGEELPHNAAVTAYLHAAAQAFLHDAPPLEQ
jgi:hypothetical protein